MTDVPEAHADSHFEAAMLNSGPLMFGECGILIGSFLAPVVWVVLIHTSIFRCVVATTDALVGALTPTDAKYTPAALLAAFSSRVMNVTHRFMPAGT